MHLLTKQPGRPFVVLNLSDPQLSSQDWLENGWKIALLKGTVDRLMAEAKPDLITITGDITRGSDTDGYRFFADWIESYGVDWAFVFGNHDNQDGADTVSRQADLLMSYPHCLFEKGDATLGCGNYSLVITENHAPVYALILMDTHDMVPYQMPDGTLKRKWAYLTPKQLDWYRQETQRLGGIPTALLMHIPFHCYESAFQQAWNPAHSPLDVTPKDSESVAYWRYPGCFGVQYEEVSAYPEDLGEIRTVAGRSELVLVGHNHNNNFVVPYQGVQLAFSLKAGAGSYWDPRLNGGTVLRITRDERMLEHLYVDPADIVGTAYQA